MTILANKQLDKLTKIDNNVENYKESIYKIDKIDQNVNEIKDFYSYEELKSVSPCIAVFEYQTPNMPTKQTKISRISTKSSLSGYKKFITSKIAIFNQIGKTELYKDKILPELKDNNIDISRGNTVVPIHIIKEIIQKIYDRMLNNVSDDIMKK